MKAVWSEDQWIQDHQSKPETTDQPVEIVDSNKVETVAKKSKPQVSNPPSVVWSVYIWFCMCNFKFISLYQ